MPSSAHGLIGTSSEKKKEEEEKGEASMEAAGSKRPANLVSENNFKTYMSTDICSLNIEGSFQTFFLNFARWLHCIHAERSRQI